MFSALLHGLAAHPRVYDWIQRLAGAGQTRRRLAPLAARTEAALILDLGGGTGLYRDLWPAGRRVVCLDIDPAKLRGLRANWPGAPALCADATRIPLGSERVDAILCTAFSHHLPDALWEQALAESARVLRPEGVFFFMDAVWQPDRPAGRLLWRYDRGSFPRTARRLDADLARHFAPTHREQYAVLHEYLLWAGAKAGRA